MQQAACRTNKYPHWTHGMALERTHGLPRGMLVSHATNAQGMVGRALASTRLDGDTLRYLSRMLIITVQDWARRKA